MNTDSEPPIVIVHLIASAGAGGGERFLLDLAKHTGSQVAHLLVIPPGGVFEKLLAQAGLHYLTIDMSRRFSIRSIGRLARIAKQHQAAIIHTHGYRANFFGSIAAFISGAKHISSVHVSLFDYRQTSSFVRSIYMLVERLSSMFTEHYICVSRAMQTDIIKLGVAQKKTTVVSNGVDTDRFYPRAEREALRKQLGFAVKEPIVGTVGRLVPEKGHSYLIEALQHLQPVWPNLKCVFIGDGPLRTDLERLAFDLGVSKMCHFLGIQTEVERYYQIFDLFVLSSLREPFGLSLLEAMASEVPVVATEAGGVLDFIHSGYNGELVRAKDAIALSQKINQLLSDRSRTQILAKRGRRSVLHSHTIERTVGKIEEVYFEVTAKQQPC